MNADSCNDLAKQGIIPDSVRNQTLVDLQCLQLQSLWSHAICLWSYIIVNCCSSMPEKKIDLKVRVYKYSSCGLVLDRDHNAALEILMKGLEQTHIAKLPLLDKTS
jgi:hypothetical protein